MAAVFVHALVRCARMHPGNHRPGRPRAPPGPRTLYPPGKSRVHVHMCLQRLRAAPGNRTPLTWLEAKGTSRCASAAWWLLLGSGQRPPGLQPGALTV